MDKGLLSKILYKKKKRLNVDYLFTFENTLHIPQTEKTIYANFTDKLKTNHLFIIGFSKKAFGEYC